VATLQVISAKAVSEELCSTCQGAPDSYASISSVRARLRVDTDRGQRDVGESLASAS
jgi:hypothetical protein